MVEQSQTGVLTLVANPIDDGLVASARGLLERVLDEVSDDDAEAPLALQWLAPGRCCELAFRLPNGFESPRLAVNEMQVSIAPHLDALAVDWCLQAMAERDVQLLVADMESTVIHNEMLDELADAIGRRDDMAAVTAQAMNDEIDFEEALAKRVSWLAGLPEAELDKAAQRIVIDPGAATLVATLKAQGVRCVLASGGFTYFAEPIAQRLGFDAYAANVLELEDGHLTGRVVLPVLDRDAKVRILHQHCEELGITPQQTLSVGDGANDLPMLQKSGLGVAYHGKPTVAASAPHKIRFGDLSTLLFYAGIPQDEWVRRHS